MATLEITLPEPLKEFVDAQVSSGHFETASEFVETLVREAEENERRIDQLLLQAIESTKPRIEVTPQFWEERRARLLSRQVKPT